MLFTRTRLDWRVVAILICAALTRETALPIIAGYSIYLASRKRFAHALLAAATALPAIAWYIWLSRLGRSSATDYVHWIPFAGFAERILHPAYYAMSPFKNGIAMALDYFALAGIALGLVYAIRFAISRRWDSVSAAVYALAIAAALIGSRSVWEEAYAFARVLTPLLLLVAFQSLESLSFKSACWAFRANASRRSSDSTRIVATGARRRRTASFRPHGSATLKKPVPAARFALAAVLFFWSWQFLTVHYNYGGNWTGLFCIAPHMPVPAFLKSEKLYIFPDTQGFDGQIYHLIAHDPWMRRGSADAILSPDYRYQRILVPALAWSLAFGRDDWVDPAYYAVILAFVFLGVYWLVHIAARRDPQSRLGTGVRARARRPSFPSIA